MPPPPPCGGPRPRGPPGRGLVTHTTAAHAPPARTRPLPVVKLLDPAGGGNPGAPQSRYSVPPGRPLFAASLPHGVRFASGSYAPYGPPLTCALAFRNCDTHARRLHVEPPPPGSPFTLAGPLGRQDGRVAPGTEACYVVTFTPGAVGEYEGCVEVVSERETYTLPLRAEGTRPRFQLPATLALPDAVVGAPPGRVTLRVYNAGDGEGELCVAVLPAPDVAAGAAGADACFTLEAADGEPVGVVVVVVPPGATASVGVRFAAAAPGPAAAVLELREVRHGGQPHRVVLSGAGVELPGVALSSHSLTLPPAFTGLSSFAAVALANPSDTAVEYTWHAHPDAATEAVAREARVALLREEHAARRRDAEGGGGATPGPALDAVLRELNAALEGRVADARSAPLHFDAPAWRLLPASGTLWARGTLDCCVEFRPTDGGAHAATAYLQVTGRAARLPLALASTGVGPQLALTYDAVDVGDVTATAVHRYEARLVNTGSIPAEWRVEAPGEDEPPPQGAPPAAACDAPGDSRGGTHALSVARCFAFHPAAGTLPPGQSVTLTAAFTSPRALGPFTHTVGVRARGTDERLTLRFSGRVVPPAFHLDATRLDYGVLPFGFPAARACALHNTSRVPLRFRFRVLHAATHAAATHAPAFLGKPHGFTVTPASGELPPGASCSVTLQLAPTAATPPSLDDAVLVMDVVGVLPAAASLPLTGTVVVSRVTLGAAVVELGPCFRGHPTPCAVTLVNADGVRGRYTLRPQDGGAEREAAVVATHGTDGAVPPHGSVDVALALTCARSGRVSLPVALDIAGRAGGPLVVELIAVGRGPRLVATAGVDGTGAAALGRVPCLAPTPHTLSLLNDSPIPASLALRMRGGAASRYAVTPAQLLLAPGGAADVTLTATLDDCVPFNDVLLVSADGDDAGTLALEVPVAARGVGASVRCAERPLFQPLDMGAVFVGAPVFRTLTLRNDGRRAVALRWSNATTGPADAARRNARTTAKRAGGSAQAAAAVAGEARAAAAPAVYSVEPANAALKPGGLVVCVLRCERGGGAGEWLETLELHARHDGDAQPVLAGRFDCRAEFWVPALRLEPASLAFLFEQPRCDAALPSRHQSTRPQTREVTLTNATPLPLECVVAVEGGGGLGGSAAVGAFDVDAYELAVAPGEARTLHVSFDPHYRDDRASHTVESTVTLHYATHARRDALRLFADVRFPNLLLDADALDFGWVLNDTAAERVVTLRNVSALPADVRWAFVEEGKRGEAPAGGVAGAAAAAGGDDSLLPYVPPNRVFDVQPLRATLAPGEALPTTVTFYGHANRAFTATAVCEVAGGPEYSVALRGRAGTAAYRVEAESLDFGRVPFHAAKSRPLALSNSGQVEYGFQLTVVAGNGGSEEGEHEGEGGEGVDGALTVFTVTPSTGRIAAGEKANVLVRAAPGLPLPATARLRVQLAHFPPSFVRLRVEGVFASAVVELPREGAAAVGTAASSPRRWRRMSVGSTGSAGDPAAPRYGRRASLRRSSLTSMQSIGSAHEPHHRAAGGRRVSRQLSAPDTAADARANTAALVSHLRQHYAAAAPRAAQPARDDASSPTPVVAAAAVAAAGMVAPLGDDVGCNSPAAALAAAPPLLGRFVLDFGPVVLGGTVERTFTVANGGRCALPAVAVASRQALAAGFAFAPALHKSVAEGGRVSFTATFTALVPRYSGTRLGPVTCELPVRVRDGPGGVLVLRALVAVPTLALLPPAGLDFGAVLVGQRHELSCQLRNTSPVPAAWVASQPSSIALRGRDKEAFDVLPSSGVLGPGERTALRVAFTPAEPQREYAVALPLRVPGAAGNLFEMELPCRGVGDEVSLTLEVEPVAGVAAAPSGVCALGPQLPGSRPSTRAVRLTNTSGAAVEVYCAELDAQAHAERTALLAATGYDEGGVQLLPVRALRQPLALSTAGTPLPGDAATAPWSPNAASASPLAPLDAPRRHGRAVTVVVASPPGSGGSTATALVSQLYRGAAVLTVDAALLWARDGGAGAALAQALATAVPPAAAALAAAGGGHAPPVLAPPDVAAHAAAMLAAAWPPAKPPSAASGKAAAARRPAPAAAQRTQDKRPRPPTAPGPPPLQPAGVTQQLLSDVLRARLALADCGYAAVVDGSEASLLVPNAADVSAAVTSACAVQLDGACTPPAQCHVGLLRVVRVAAPGFLPVSERLASDAAAAAERLHAALAVAERADSGVGASFASALEEVGAAVSALGAARDRADRVDAAHFEAGSLAAGQLEQAVVGAAATASGDAAASLVVTLAAFGGMAVARAALAAGLPPMPEPATPFNTDLQLPPPETLLRQLKPAPQSASAARQHGALLRHFRVATAEPVAPPPPCPDAAVAPPRATSSTGKERGGKGGVPKQPAQRRGGVAPALQEAGRAVALSPTPPPLDPPTLSASALLPSGDFSADVAALPSCRWVLQPGESVPLSVSFAASAPGSVEGRLTFGVLGSRYTAELAVAGVCALPQLSVSPVVVARRAPRDAGGAAPTPAAGRRASRNFRDAGSSSASAAYEFGPLVAGRSVDSVRALLETGANPHVATFVVRNTGLLPTSADLSLLAPVDSLLPWHAGSGGAEGSMPLLADVLAAGAASRPGTAEDATGRGATVPAAAACFSVVPRRIEHLPPGQSAAVQVWALPGSCSGDATVGTLRWNVLVARSEHNPAAVYCPLTCVATESDVALRGPWGDGERSAAPLSVGAAPAHVLDFGRALCGRVKSCGVTLESRSLLPLLWRAQKQPDGDAQGGRSLTLTPSGGILLPGRSASLTATFSAGDNDGSATASVALQYTDAAAGWGVEAAAPGAEGDADGGGPAVKAAPAAAGGSKPGAAAAKGGKGRSPSQRPSTPAPTSWPGRQRLLTLMGEAFSVLPVVTVVVDDVAAAPAPPAAGSAPPPPAAAAPSSKKAAGTGSRPPARAGGQSAGGIGAAAGADGKTAGARLAAVPTTLALAFGAHRVPASASRQIAVHNAGRFPFDARLALCLPSDGVLRPNTPSVCVAPGATERLALEFSPGGAAVLDGVHVADLVIADAGAGVGDVAHTIAVTATASAAFASCVLTPARSLHFGPLRAGGPPRSRTLDLRNTGAFPLNFSVVATPSLDDTPALEEEACAAAGSASAQAPAPPAAAVPVADAVAAKSPASKGSKGRGDNAVRAPLLASPPTADAPAAAVQVVVGCFAVTPAGGTVPPGESVTLTAAYSPAGNGVHRRTVRVQVAGYDPASTGGGLDDLTVTLLGESCVPCIAVGDPATLFEEHPLADTLAQLSRGPHPSYASLDHLRFGGWEGAMPATPQMYTRTQTGYATTERTFSYGVVDLGEHGDRSGRASHGGSGGVTERVRLDNPTKTPVTITVAIRDTPADGSDDAPAGCAAVFSSPIARADIQPYGTLCLPLAFLPRAVGVFSGVVEVGVEGGGTGASFRLRGEAVLPVVAVDRPPLALPTAGAALTRTLAFGQVAVGTAPVVACVTLRNAGMLPAVAHLRLQPAGAAPDGGAPQPMSFALCNPARAGGDLDDEVVITLPAGGSADVPVAFAPSAGAHYAAATVGAGGGGGGAAGVRHAAELTVVTSGNAFAQERVALVGHSVAFDVTLQLPDSPQLDSAALAGGGASSLAFAGAALDFGAVGVTPGAPHERVLFFDAVNTCDRPVRFAWREPPSAELSLSPRCGHIPAGGRARITATWRCADTAASTPQLLGVEQVLRVARVTYDPRFAEGATALRAALFAAPLAVTTVAAVAAVAAAPAGKAPPAAKPATSKPSAVAVKAVGGAAVAEPATPAAPPLPSTRLAAKRHLAAPPAEPLVTWADTDGDVEPAYAVVDDRVEFVAGSGAVDAVEGAAGATLDDGGRIAPAAGEGDVTEELPLAVRGVADVLRVHFHRPGDAADVGGDPTTLAFQPTFLQQSRSTAVTVSNPSRVPAHFVWAVTPRRDGSRGAEHDSAGHVEGAAPEMRIHPAAGTIAPGASTDFRVQFAPGTEGECAAVAVLLALPTPCAPRDGWSGGANDPTVTDAAHPLLALRLEGTGLRPLCHIDLPPSGYLATRPAPAPPPRPGEHTAATDAWDAALAGAVSDPSSRVIELRSVGARGPVDARFRLLNTSDRVLRFAWVATPGSSTAVRCVTPAGVAPPGCHCELAFEFTPPFPPAAVPAPSAFEAVYTLQLLTDDAAGSPTLVLQQAFLVAGVIAEPQLSLDRAAVTFPHTLLGATVSSEVWLGNDEVGTSWEFRAHVVDASAAPTASHAPALADAHAAPVTVEPRAGVALPGQRVRLLLRFRPTSEGAVNTQLRVHVAGMARVLCANAKGEAFELHEELSIAPGGVRGLLPAGCALEPASEHLDSGGDAAVTGVRLQLDALPRAFDAVQRSRSAEPRDTPSNSLDFGDVPVSGAAVHRVVLNNRGVFSLTWEAVLSAAAGAPSRRHRGGGRNHGGAGVANDGMQMKAFTVSLGRGAVPPGGAAVAEVTYAPTFPISRAAATLTLVVSGVQRYTVRLHGSASRPAIEFSALRLDWGEQLLPPSGAALPTAAVRTLTLTNREASRPLGVQLVQLTQPSAGSAPCWEVGLPSTAIERGQSLEVPVTFRPTDARAVTGTAVFEVDGMHRVSVALAGSAAPLHVEVLQPPGGVLALGSVAPRDAVTRAVRVVNRSRCPVVLALLDGAADQAEAPVGAGASQAAPPLPRSLSARGVSILPRRALVLPRQALTVEVRYAPGARAPAFTEPLLYAAAAADATGGLVGGFSQPVPLLALSGACASAGVRLESDVADFGRVVAGCVVARSVLLVNDGDVEAGFTVGGAAGAGGAGALAPFTLTPTHGRVKPQGCVALDVAFQPAAATAGDATISRRALIHVVAVGPFMPGVASQQLALTLVGVSAPRPSPAPGPPVPFACRVRESATHVVALPGNPSDAPQVVSPSFTHAYWTGPASVTLPARAPPGTAYPVTYRPLEMTLGAAAAGGAVPPGRSPRPDHHNATAFFPLGSGDGLTLAFSGSAAPPAPQPELALTLLAKARHNVALTVTNWLPVSQRFDVTWPPEALPPSAELHGPTLVELPARATTELRMSYCNLLASPMPVRVTVTLTSAATGEYIAYPLLLTTTEPPPGDAVALSAVVRGTAAHTLVVDNPLWQRAPPGRSACGGAGQPSAAPRGGPVTFSRVSCDHPGVRVTQLDALAGRPSGRFRVEFRPLVPTGAVITPVSAAEVVVHATAEPGGAAAAPPPTGAGSAPGKAPGTSGKGGGSKAGGAAARAASPPPPSPPTAGLPAGGADPAGASVAAVTLVSPQIGTTVVRLALSATPAPPLPPLSFVSPLGGRVTLPAAFRHHGSAGGTYACTVTPADAGFAVPRTVDVQPGADAAAAWTGVEAAVPVTHDGSRLGPTSAELRIAGPPGCSSYVIPLLGESTPPAPAGPFAVAPAAPASLSFRSPFLEPADFHVGAERTDGLGGSGGAAAFVAMPSGVLRLPAKGTAVIAVALGVGGVAGGAAATGRVVVSCPAAPHVPPWVYYLQQVPGGGAPGAGQGTPAQPTAAEGGAAASGAGAARKAAAKRGGGSG